LSIRIEAEVDAIGSIFKALSKLDASGRKIVLDYVLSRLEVDQGVVKPVKVKKAAKAAKAIKVVAKPPVKRGRKAKGKRGRPKLIISVPASAGNLKKLVKQKKPKSAIEMATLLSYYLANVAPQAERKQKIGTKDIEAYFKAGGYKLPSKPQFTLPNTKNAGYLDNVGSGEYKLSQKGLNLILSLPKGAKAKKGKVGRPSGKKRGRKPGRPKGKARK
jgi:hypothetical protein